MDFVLINSPLVGASSWRPTANVLRQAGTRVHVPDVVTSNRVMPAWHDWPDAIASLLPPLDQPILVGHSAAGILIAALATKLGAGGLIFVDAQIPPASGPTPPAEPSFHSFVNSIADSEGVLPPWSHWWGPTAILNLFTDPALKSEFEAGLPRQHLSWYDDSLDLKPWRHVPAGYIQTSAVFTPTADEAERLGWPTIRLTGTHLHPTLAPEETAHAIQSIAARLK